MEKHLKMPACTCFCLAPFQAISEQREHRKKIALFLVRTYHEFVRYPIIANVRKIKVVNQPCGITG